MRLIKKEIEPTYTFSMSEKEALVLYHILRCVGGAPNDTPRGISDGILAVLDDALKGESILPFYKTLQSTGGVYFGIYKSEDESKE